MMLALRRPHNTPGEFWEGVCLCPASATSCRELSQVSKMKKRRNRAIDLEWIIATSWIFKTVFSLFIGWLNKVSAWWNGVFFLYVVDSKPGWSWLVEQNFICGHELRNACQRKSYQSLRHEVSGWKNLKNWLLRIFSISTLPEFSRDLHSRLPRFFHHHVPTLQFVFFGVSSFTMFYTFKRSPCLPFFLWSFL